MSRTYSPYEIAQVFSEMVAGQLKDPNAPAFYLWARPDRAIISVNPRNIKSQRGLLSGQFEHDLSTQLQGARVVKTNSIGIFFQVSYSARQPLPLGDKYPLDLSQQKGPLDVPIGMTAARGPLWIPVRETGGVLVGGSSGFGKTILLHAWIRALIQGQACQVVLYDGKNGNHFRRYANQPGVTLASDLDQALEQLDQELGSRQDTFLEHEVHDLDAYNALGWVDPLKPIILIVDEAALIPPASAEKLAELVRTGREQGLTPICATQRTSTEDVDPRVKANLQTRICFPVPATGDSMVVLGKSGAERLRKTRGRLLINWGARLVEAQAFFVDLTSGAPTSADVLPIGSDRLLAIRAAKETEGRLSIPILKGWGMSPYRAERLLQEWQARGWVESSTGGQGAIRRLSPRVYAVLSESLKVSESLKDNPAGPAWPEMGVSTETESA